MRLNVAFSYYILIVHSYDAGVWCSGNDSEEVRYREI